MSTPRRLFDDPRNTYIVDNNDPGAFDKRFVGRPGVHREQRCCRDRAPVWQPHLLHDGEDAGRDNKPAYKDWDSVWVQDETGEPNNSGGKHPGQCWVFGPKSGYKPDFISAEEWMRWQSVYWIPSPNSNPMLPNPPRWVRLPGERKIRPFSGAGSYYELQWCKKCETPLESAWSDVLEVFPIAARGIAMIASYVPVYGTAISLTINSAVSLAEGESIIESVLDGVRGALPGQPTSGVVFDVGVAIGKGERVDHAFIDGFVIDNNLKSVLKAAADIVYAVASGRNITDTVFNEVHRMLPPEAQQGMNYARRVINGENVGEMILSEAEQAVVNHVRSEAQFILDDAREKGAEALSEARAKVDSMFNQYAVEFGYQMALDRLSPAERACVQLGLAGGAALPGPQQFIGTFGVVSERNKAVNDGYEAQGQALIASGIIYKSRPVSDILTRSKFAIVVDFYDALNSVWTTRNTEYDVSDAWRRCFTIAIAVCEGSSERGPDQLAVYQSMGEGDMRRGFDAGQAVQHNRSLYGDRGLSPEVLSTNVPSPFGQAQAEAREDRPIEDIVRDGGSPFGRAKEEGAAGPSIEDHVKVGDSPFRRGGGRRRIPSP